MALLMYDILDTDAQLELVRTRLRKYTFEVPKVRAWVESNSDGYVLNLFAGMTSLNLDEVRNDLNQEANADYHMDCLDFVQFWKDNEDELFDTIILDPPYNLRKSMELYEGRYTSRFKKLADALQDILKPNGKIISFGYHSTFMGKGRNFKLDKMCIFAHGGSQHCTIAIIESRFCAKEVKVKLGNSQNNAILCKSKIASESPQSDFIQDKEDWWPKL